MSDLKMDRPEQFAKWLEEEMTYLQGLTKEPPEEVWQMNYVEKLMVLKKAK